MEAPEIDIEDRSKIWDAMQMLYMDTDPKYELDYIARICVESKYTNQELRDILFFEVLPSVRFNLLMLPAPEWRGFEIKWLINRVLDKHRFGRRKPIFFRTYTSIWWKKLEDKIEYLRKYS